MRLVEDHVLRDHLQANTKKGFGPSYGPVNGMLKSSTPDPELTPNSNQSLRNASSSAKATAMIKN